MFLNVGNIQKFLVAIMYYVDISADDSDFSISCTFELSRCGYTFDASHTDWQVIAKPIPASDGIGEEMMDEAVDYGMVIFTVTCS